MPLPPRAAAVSSTPSRHKNKIVHADGSREYDAHNLFGTTMALQNTKVANDILGKRGFYILRWVWLSWWGPDVVLSPCLFPPSLFPTCNAPMLSQRPLTSTLATYLPHCVTLCVHINSPTLCKHRSTSPGAGRVTGHWTGDNGATWESFYQSIAANLNSNMWGLAMSGSDVCGFWDSQKYAHSGKEEGPLPDAEYQHLCNRCVALLDAC